MVTVFVCLDDNNGMMFGKRRQSMDAKVREDILKSVPKEKRLMVTAYTAKQFASETERLWITEALPSADDEDTYFFSEATPLAPIEKVIHTLIIYRWNRRYPADVYLDLDLSEWEERESTEFAGNSHEKISRLTYYRRTNQ
ncbi:MAG: ribonuclease Z [Lachnospiraceae bacterium]